MNFFTLTFRALGRNHIASTPGWGPSQCFVLIRQSDSPEPCQFRAQSLWAAGNAGSTRHDAVPREGIRARNEMPKPTPAGSTSRSRKATVSSPANAPSLRANPSSEGTDLVCRLPLPTLIYRQEAVHLGDLLRIWVRSGATPPRSPRTDFQGPDVSSPDAAPCWRRSSLSQNPISLGEDSRASAAYGEKITLPEAHAGVSVSCRVTATNRQRTLARTPPGVRRSKTYRFRCRVPEFWPVYLSPCE